MSVNTIKWGHFNVARTVWCFWLAACKYVSIFKEFATDNSNEQCRKVLVWFFYDHKCRHSVMFRWRGAKTVWVIIISNYVLTEGNTCLVYSGFRAGTRHHNMVRGLRYSAHNALDSWPIIAHFASQNDELCKNRRVSERRGIEEQQLCAVCGKYCVSFNLEPRKHIASHQIHKIMLFLATSYDSFKKKKKYMLHIVC